MPGLSSVPACLADCRTLGGLSLGGGQSSQLERTSAPQPREAFPGSRYRNSKSTVSSGMPAGVVLAGRDWPGAMGAGTGTSPRTLVTLSQRSGVFVLGQRGKWNEKDRI